MTQSTGLVPGLAAGALALLAHVLPGELDLLLRSRQHVVQRDDRLRLEVVAALHAAGAARRGGRCPAAEDVGEEVGDVVDVHAREVVPRRPAAQAGVAVAVVALPLLAVGEHLVGLRALLEARLRRRVAGVAVGVVLHRHLAVLPLDDVAVGGPLDGEDLVVVALGGHEGACFRQAGRSLLSGRAVVSVVFRRCCGVCRARG